MISEMARLTAEAGSVVLVLVTVRESVPMTSPEKLRASIVMVLLPGVTGTVSCQLLLSVQVASRAPPPARRKLRTSTQPSPARDAELPFTVWGFVVVIVNEVGATWLLIWLSTLFEREVT